MLLSVRVSREIAHEYSIDSDRIDPCSSSSSVYHPREDPRLASGFHQTTLQLTRSGVYRKVISYSLIRLYFPIANRGEAIWKESNLSMAWLSLLVGDQGDIYFSSNGLPCGLIVTFLRGACVPLGRDHSSRNNLLYLSWPVLTVTQ